MRLRLLVTGASGFIGRNLLLALPRDHCVTATYRAGDLPAFLRTHRLEHVEAAQVDLADARQVQARLGSPWDAVVFLAANGDPNLSADRPSVDVPASLLPVLYLMEACRTDRFLFLSSGAVYDGLTGPVHPGSPVAPVLPYAVAKLAIEHYLRYFRERARRIERLSILRFFGAYGPYEPPRKVYTKLVEAFAFRRERVFAIRGDGTNLIDAMYVDDAVEGLLAVLDGEGEAGVLDFGTGRPQTVEQLVRQAAAVFGVDDVRVDRHGRTAEPIGFRMDPAPMAERYGFRAHTSLAEGLRRHAAFLAASRPGPEPGR